MAQQQARNTGSFIPTSNVWDVSQIYSTEVTKPEFKELLVRLFQNLNNMALSVNGKDAGIYHTDEFVNGQVFFPNPALNSSTTSKPEQRQVYRKVVNFGALLNTAAKSEPHGLTMTNSVSMTRMYGAATDPVGLNYVAIPNTDIKLVANNQNVTITTTANYAAYTICYVVLEYLKS